jgi:hypothetical protein
MTLLLMAAMPAITPAAQLTVFPGESIQAKITAAAAGDEIVIFEGTYSEDLTINKNVVLRKPEGAAVFLTGNVTLSGITTAYTLANFKIGGDRTKRLYINNCTDVVAQDLDLTQSYGVDSTSTTKLRLYRIDNTGGSQTRIIQCADFETKNCTFGSFLAERSLLVLRQGVYGVVDASWCNCYCLGSNMTRISSHHSYVEGAAGTGPSTLVCFRCNLPTGDGVNGVIGSRATYNWICYNTAKGVYYRHEQATAVNPRVIVTGNVFDQQFNYVISAGNVMGDSNCRAAVFMHNVNQTKAAMLKINNNIIRNIGRQSGSTSNSDGNSWLNGIYIEGYQNGAFNYEINNNIIHDITQRQPGSGELGVRSNAIVCTSGSTGVVVGKIYNNLIYNVGDANYHTQDFSNQNNNKGCSISCPSNGTYIAGNFIHRPGVTGFAPGYQAIIDPALNILGTAPPTFAEAATYTLPADSPLKNAGINDPRFNDFDGTRNDIGIWGGTQFDPEGRTTYKPVVLGFDLTPDQTLDGVTNEVQLLNIGAVVLDP